jgi:hypothetical protein
LLIHQSFVHRVEVQNLAAVNFSKKEQFSKIILPSFGIAISKYD